MMAVAAMSVSCRKDPAGVVTLNVGASFENPESKVSMLNPEAIFASQRVWTWNAEDMVGGQFLTASGEKTIYCSSVEVGDDPSSAVIKFANVPENASFTGLRVGTEGAYGRVVSNSDIIPASLVYATAEVRATPVTGELPQCRLLHHCSYIHVYVEKVYVDGADIVPAAWSVSGYGLLGKDSMDTIEFSAPLHTSVWVAISNTARDISVDARKNVSVVNVAKISTAGNGRTTIYCVRNTLAGYEFQQ